MPKEELLDSAGNDDLLNCLDEAEPMSSLQEENIDDRPDLSSPEWQDYVFSFLKPDEMVGEGKNRFPRADGLRRIFPLLIGRITESYPEVIQCPTFTGHLAASEKTGSKFPFFQAAIVKWTIKYVDDFGNECIYSDVGSCHLHNTELEFARHGIETAATKAEGRTLRKALRLRTTITAEENMTPKETLNIEQEEELITPTEISMLKMISKKKKVDMWDFFKENDAEEFATADSIYDMPRDLAKTLLRKLQKGE